MFLKSQSESHLQSPVMATESVISQKPKIINDSAKKLDWRREVQLMPTLRVKPVELSHDVNKP